MINIDISNYTAMLDSIYDQGNDLPLDEIGQLLVESVHENFRLEGRPERWAERQDDNPWPILYYTGTLYDSIHYNTYRDEVTVDDDTDYGVWHNVGTSRLPKREFYLIQDEDEREIMDLIAQSFQS